MSKWVKWFESEIDKLGPTMERQHISIEYEPLKTRIRRIVMYKHYPHLQSYPNGMSISKIFDSWGASKTKKRLNLWLPNKYLLN